MSMKEQRLSGLKNRIRGTLLLPSTTSLESTQKTKPGLPEVHSKDQCQKTKNSDNRERFCLLFFFFFCLFLF